MLNYDGSRQQDLPVDDWLKTLGIESLCQWDTIVFLDRHPSILVGTEYIARLLGYAAAEVLAALDSLKTSGLVEYSRVSQEVRFYQVTASADATRRDAWDRLMTLADSRTARLLLARRLRGRDRPE
ncbi:MAG TPA: helix-turn-helix domain-containing protein [Gemmataceae bacterium]|jgi:DNA-binding MarR family transcriptional regulator|nr:helix-turn-helix domain-containing protein [Gemmataceae bacterium]